MARQYGPQAWLVRGWQAYVNVSCPTFHAVIVVASYAVIVVASYTVMVVASYTVMVVARNFCQ